MAARIADLRARIDRVLRRGRRRSSSPIVITSVGHSVDRAELVYDTLRDTTAPATGAAVLIGLVVVLAAAGYWVQRREREVRLLAAHGASPRALAVKAALEALLALTGRRGRRAGGGVGAGAGVRPEPAALGRGRAVGARPRRRRVVGGAAGHGGRRRGAGARSRRRGAAPPAGRPPG